MVTHLPPEAASRRAAGQWPHAEQIADLTLQHLTAMRAEAISAVTRKRPPFQPTSYIAERIKAATPTTVADAIARLKGAQVPKRADTGEG